MGGGTGGDGQLAPDLVRSGSRRGIFGREESGTLHLYLTYRTPIDLRDWKINLNQYEVLA